MTKFHSSFTDQHALHTLEQQTQGGAPKYSNSYFEERHEKVNIKYIEKERSRIKIESTVHE